MLTVTQFLFSRHPRVLSRKKYCYGKTVIKCGLRMLVEELVLFKELAKDC